MSLASQIDLLATRIGQEIKSVKAYAISRANHTGTQLAATISDFDTAADARVVAGITGKQDLDTELTAIAGLTSAANRVPYFTGSGTAALATFTSAGRALVDDASATAQRTTLDVYSKSETDLRPNFNWVQEAQPTASIDGQLWYDTATGKSYIWYDSFWVQM